MSYSWSEYRDNSRVAGWGGGFLLLKDIKFLIISAPGFWSKTAPAPEDFAFLPVRSYKKSAYFPNWGICKNVEISKISKILWVGKQNLQGQEQFLTQIQGQKL